VHRKNVLVVTKQPELAHKLKTILNTLDIEVCFAASSISSVLQDSLTLDFELVVLDVDRETLKNLGAIEQTLFEEGSPALFLIIAPESLAEILLPVRLQTDFVVRTALDIEYQVRIHQLLWPGEEAGSTDFIRVANLTLNLATYQVKVDGNTLDLTYLEYALLAFLITHPGRTYSRDALLRRVWGFDYYGGSRTVDVHVRRVRSKLGPELAKRLETVRGIGYLWNA
jgi:DNA-binding response OmpR family regulator